MLIDLFRIKMLQTRDLYLTKAAAVSVARQCIVPVADYEWSGLVVVVVPSTSFPCK